MAVKIHQFEKKTLVIYLMGGLGNVLFQINFAYNLRDAGYNIRLNVYSLMSNNIISKMLKWSNHNTLNNIFELGILDGFEIDDKFRLSFMNALWSKKTGKNIFGTKFYGINSPSHSEIINVTNLFGYFHNKNPVNDFFVNHLQERLNIWLSLKKNLQELIGKLIKHDDIIVHVRGGDFTTDSNLELGVDYYKKAIAAATNNCGSVLVLTNDALYAESILCDLPFQIISQDSPIADFIIIMKSRIKVLANSTFSWWAAELSDNKCTIVEVDSYYPKLNWLPLSKKQKIRVGRTTN
jgi:hypothetical protein